MSRWIERYLAGEHEAVWVELRALGASIVEQPDAWRDAEAVAAETMRRVRANLELLQEHLRARSFRFHSPCPLAAPAPDAAEKLERVERAIGGRFPISIRAFILHVGQVDFTGELGGWRPRYADELQVLPYFDGLEDSLLDSIEDRFFADGDENAGRAFLDLSADHLHKANISGGAPYGVAVPDPSADALWLHDDLHSRRTFVQYLRETIADGGLPGWRRTSGNAPPPRLDELVEGLNGF